MILTLRGHDPNFATQNGYSGAQVVLEGLKRTGKDLTPDTFVAAIESTKDYHGIFGSSTISFSKDKHRGLNEWFLCVVKDAQWVPAIDKPIGY